MTYKELFYKATRLIEHHQITIGEYEEMTKPLDREVEQETVSKEVYDHEYFLRKEFELKIDKLQRQLEEQAVKAESILNKLKAEINKNIEQEDFARSVFLYEEKDLDRANKCVGILEAYKKVLDMINNLLKENNDG